MQCTLFTCQAPTLDWHCSILSFKVSVAQDFLPLLFHDRTHPDHDKQSILKFSFNFAEIFNHTVCKVRNSDSVCITFQSKTFRLCEHRLCILLKVQLTSKSFLYIWLPLYEQPEISKIIDSDWLHAVHGMHAVEFLKKIEYLYSKGNLNWIRKYFSLFIRNPDVLESWKEVENLVTKTA